MIASLNRVLEQVETHLSERIDVAALAKEVGTTEYHLRRMFSSLAGMPLSEYIRRRRMTLAAADLLGHDDLLDIAVRWGYGSALGTTEPTGLLQVSADVDTDYTEGSELTYLHGVAVDDEVDVPADLDIIDVPAGAWAVFTTSGAFPDLLQETWAATATEWFPSNAWRLRPGPSIVSVLDRSDDFRTATCELWLPVERD
ncbi:GyrI-like domain-containing protein [Microbacterium sp. 179-I 3D2 NHS]|uniref:GyrI-like domain-containing protein n=1 Tax=Microbacterium sp. 179-I 3D2 NHS TaxID=3235178 RepID=UPI0039A39433